VTCGKVGLLRGKVSLQCAELNGLKAAIGADNKGFYRRIIFLGRIFKMARFPRTEAEVMGLAILRISLSQAMVVL
jgi:hypothetical protein